MLSGLKNTIGATVGPGTAGTPGVVTVEKRYKDY